MGSRLSASSVQKYYRSRISFRTFARKSSIGELYVCAWGLYVCAGGLEVQIWQKFH